MSVLKKHFVSLSIFQIMAQFRRGIFYFFLSIYLKEYLNITNTEMTLFATLPMIANIASQSGIWGRLSDKYKKRRLLIVFGEIYAAVGYLVVFWIHKGYETGGALRAAAFTIIIGFTIIEAGWSSSNLGWTALIADLTRDSERSRTMGLLQFVGGIGNVIGVTASGFLYKDGIGFAGGNLFFISSGIMIFSVIALFLIPESYEDFEKSDNEELSAIVKEQRRMRKDIGSDSKSLKWDWKLFVWLLVILAVINIGGNSIGQLLNIHVRLSDTFNASDMVVAQLRNTTNISMIVAGLVIGFLTSKFGDGKMLLVGFILAFVGIMLLPFAPHIIFVFIYMSFRGFTRVWVNTTAYSMVNRVVPLEVRGKMMGYYNATFYLSWGLGGTILTGPIADAIVGSNLPIIMIYTVLGLLISGLWIFMMVEKISELRKHKKLFIGSIVGWIGILSVIISFAANPIASYVINYGTSDSYSYKVTFLIAAIIVLMGILTYIFYRPKTFDSLILDRNNIKNSIT